jgi:hypothetical protein
MKKYKSFKHVSNLWNDAEATKLQGVGSLVCRSNKLGADQRITNTGGNTSSKLMETDPFTGEKVEMLWVKGSGGEVKCAAKGGARRPTVERSINRSIQKRGISRLSCYGQIIPGNLILAERLRDGLAIVTGIC